MAYPTPDYPASIDPEEFRTDGVDINYAADFGWLEQKTRLLEQKLGAAGNLIGELIAGSGIAGALSAIASGGTAFKLAARSAFSAGNLLSVGDANDTSYVEKFSVAFNGIVGLNPLGSLGAAGTEGRLAYETGAGLKVDNGSDWIPAGGGATSYDFATGEPYTQAAVPVEQVAGYGAFLGELGENKTLKFKATLSQNRSAVGFARVRLYDVGPVGSPPATPRAVCDLDLTDDGGPYTLTQTLTVVETAPVANQILDTDRKYEVVIYQETTAGDTMFLGNAAMEIT